MDGFLTAAAALVVLGYGARLLVNGEFIKLLALRRWRIPAVDLTTVVSQGPALVLAPVEDDRP